MRVVLAADHAGCALNERLRAHLAARGHEVLDVGVQDATPSDHPDHALANGLAVLDGRAERAILVCGSGVGVAAAANELPGIRAGLCHDRYSPVGDHLLRAQSVDSGRRGSPPWWRTRVCPRSS